MTSTHHPCVVCADKNRTRPAHGSTRLCAPCRDYLAATLDAIVTLAAQAHLSLTPTATAENTRSSGFASRPPLNVDAIDPELATIELWPGDPSSAVPILEMLEMWERSIREQRRLTPFGPASSARTEPALTETVRFLRSHLDHIATSDTFDVVDFTTHLTAAKRTLTRWDTDKDATSWGLACPNTRNDDRPCGAWIRWERGATSTTCPRCGREWDVSWLMRVAGDVWLDSDTIAHLTGIPRRTIQYWGQHGKVARRGLLYRLGDITGAPHSTTA